MGNVGETGEIEAFTPLSGDDLERMDAGGCSDEDEAGRLVETAIYYREQALEGLLYKDVLHELLASLDRTRFCGMADKARTWLRTGIPPSERRVTYSGSSQP